jgi:hypothetical protein
MEITQCIWLKQFEDKIEGKHSIYREEVEEVFRKPATVQVDEEGTYSKVRISTELLGRQRTAVICWCSSSTKVTTRP